MPEKMDADDLPPREHHEALDSLQRLNRASQAAEALWREVHALCQRERLDRLTVLDVASGGGDVPTALATLAKRHGIELNITGIDRSPLAVEHAQRHAPEGIGFVRCDAVHEPLPGAFDIVTSSLFLHHLDRSECVTVLAKMRRSAQRLVLVDDLRRSPAGWAVAWAACRALSRSPIVHYDGPVSVAAAWTPAELRELAREAGMARATVRTRWPWRMLLSCPGGES